METGDLKVTNLKGTPSNAGAFIRPQLHTSEHVFPS